MALDVKQPKGYRKAWNWSHRQPEPRCGRPFGSSIAPFHCSRRLGHDGKCGWGEPVDLNPQPAAGHLMSAELGRKHMSHLGELKRQFIVDALPERPHVRFPYPPQLGHQWLQWVIEEAVEQMTRGDTRWATIRVGKSDLKQLHALVRWLDGASKRGTP